MLVIVESIYCVTSRFTITLVLSRGIVMWRQKSKIQWAKEGHTNSRFFHQMVKGRMGRSLINGLEIDGGGFVEYENGIEKVILEFFKNLYSRYEVHRPGIQLFLS